MNTATVFRTTLLILVELFFLITHRYSYNNDKQDLSCEKGKYYWKFACTLLLALKIGPNPLSSHATWAFQMLQDIIISPISMNHISYLVIKISSQLLELSKHCFHSLWQDIFYVMSMWPKIKYSFSVMPVQPCSIWFEKPDYIRLSRFYWNSRPPTIILCMIQKSKTYGGFKFPNFLQESLPTNVNT